MHTQEYKTRLDQELKTLEEQLRSLGQPNPQNPADWEASPVGDFAGNDADPNVAADALEEYGGNTAILHELEARLLDVRRALGKIEAGTYGVCEVGGEAIEPERLHADPTARTCMEHIAEEDTLPR